MSGVDVLAAMDSASINLFEVGRPADGRKLDEARAAVAELIEAAQYALELAVGLEGMSRNNAEQIAAEVSHRLSPALSRVLGAE